jgi:hypothetical protein
MDHWVPYSERCQKAGIEMDDRCLPTEEKTRRERALQGRRDGELNEGYVPFGILRIWIHS